MSVLGTWYPVGIRRQERPVPRHCQEVQDLSEIGDAFRTILIWQPERDEQYSIGARYLYRRRNRPRHYIRLPWTTERLGGGDGRLVCFAGAVRGEAAAQGTLN